AWMGYDIPRNLGRGETGGRAALPIWIRYMQETLKGQPVYQYKVPDGVLQLKVDAATGAQVGEDDDGIYDYFYEEYLPHDTPQNLPSLTDPDSEEHGPSFLERLINDISSGNSNEDKKLPVNPAAKLLNPN
ncbi:MAG TPA: penicillin-binding protein 1A, partial [Methylophilus sp.]